MPNLPRVLNFYKDGIPEGAIYIGRNPKHGNPKWGNPFEIGRDGNRDEVCDKYEKWLYEQPELIRQAREELRRHDLCCYCAPKRCHGIILLRVANQENPVSKIMKIQPLREYLPTMDGIDHINAWSRGKTKLGRNLSNFAPIGFTHPEYGRFASVESLWFWLSTGKQHHHLKNMVGLDAKTEGKKYPVVKLPDFRDQIEQAIRLKIFQNELLRQAFEKNTLPVTHYYVVGQGLNQVPLYHHTTQWFTYFYHVLWQREFGAFKDKEAVRLLIVGSSTVDQRQISEAILRSNINIKEIVSVDGKGINSLVTAFAFERNIPFKEFKTNWDRDDQQAAFIRDQDTADYSDVLLVIENGSSKEIAFMIEAMRKCTKPVMIINVMKQTPLST